MKFTIEMNIHELSRSIAAGTLEGLVNDIKDHEAEVRAGKTIQPKIQPTTQPQPEPQESIESSSEVSNSASDSKEKESKITEVDIRAKFVELNKKGKKKELKALLDKLGVAKVSDIQPEQYEEAWAGLEAL